MLRALHCDLIVAAHPKPADLPSGWSAERLLLATGIPVLMIPAGWGGETIGENVLIAWNRSREARRAVNDAIQLLNSASNVTNITIDRDRHPERLVKEHGANQLAPISTNSASVGKPNIT